jgi:hypothetical protein
VFELRNCVRKGGMYTLLQGFYRWATQREEFFILLLGLDNAGKTVRRRCFEVGGSHSNVSTDSAREDQDSLWRSPRITTGQDHTDHRFEQ